MNEQKMKYWVSDLSEKALQLLKNHVTKQLKQLDLTNEEYVEYMNDLENEKLDNLEELVSYDLRLKYSQMD